VLSIATRWSVGLTASGSVVRPSAQRTIDGHLYLSKPAHQPFGWPGARRFSAERPVQGRTAGASNPVDLSRMSVV